MHCKFYHSNEPRYTISSDSYLRSLVIRLYNSARDFWAQFETSSFTCDVIPFNTDALPSKMSAREPDQPHSQQMLYLQIVPPSSNPPNPKPTHPMPRRGRPKPKPPLPQRLRIQIIKQNLPIHSKSSPPANNSYHNMVCMVSPQQMPGVQILFQ